MAEDRIDDLIGRRLALYAYLEPLLTGRRVLEISSVGRGAGYEQSTQYLRALGARVVSVDRDASVQVDDRFDVVVIPEAEELARRTGAFAALRKLLVDGGRVIVAAANVDRAGEGVGYYDLHGAVAAHFAHVQMFGVTPFVGMGIVEFEGAVDGLRIDSRLVKEGSEPPALYVAVGGTQVAPGLGYALVQLPFAPIETRLAAGGGGAPAPGSALLREEIDELRGRLRRAAEDRAALDAEVTTLRRALAEADESVVNLTRKTTAEMSAMAEQPRRGTARVGRHAAARSRHRRRRGARRGRSPAREAGGGRSARERRRAAPGRGGRRRSPAAA